MLKFAEAILQSRSGCIPFDKAQEEIEKKGECFHWRVYGFCKDGAKCAMKHYGISKGLDNVIVRKAARADQADSEFSFKSVF